MNEQNELIEKTEQTLPEVSDSLRDGPAVIVRRLLNVIPVDLESLLKELDEEN